MSEAAGAPVPRSFWIISSVALLWNLIGLATYIAQVTMSADTLAALPAPERALYENVPWWATSAYALAVNAGILGCLALLLRKAWATPLLIVSLVAVVVQFYHAFVVANALEVHGAQGLIVPVLILGIAIALVWYANSAKGKGWIT